MKKQVILSIGLASTLFSSSLVEQKQFDLVQSIIPGTKIEKVKPSIVSGFYEAYFQDGSLMYIVPDKRLIFMGEIYASTGTSVTQNSIKEYKENNNIKTPLEQSIHSLKTVTKENQEYLKTLVNNGIQIGTSQKHKHKIVVIKSLSCPNCTNLDNYLETKKDVVTYAYQAPSEASRKLYLQKYNINKPRKKLKEQRELVVSRLQGFGVPFALIIDDEYNLVDTIHGFDKVKWDRYIEVSK